MHREFASDKVRKMFITDKDLGRQHGCLFDNVFNFNQSKNRCKYTIQFSRVFGKEFMLK